MNRNQVDEIISNIAKEYNVTPAEIREDISTLIDAAAFSENIEVKRIWNEIPRQGDRITVDEFISFFSDYLILKK